MFNFSFKNVLYYIWIVFTILAIGYMFWDGTNKIKNYYMIMGGQMGYNNGITEGIKYGIRSGNQTVLNQLIIADEQCQNLSFTNPKTNKQIVYMSVACINKLSNTGNQNTNLNNTPNK